MKASKSVRAQKHPRLQKSLFERNSGYDPGSGRIFPSGMGQQSTLMVVTQDPELVARLSKMNAAVMGSTSDPFYGAPTVIIVFPTAKWAPVWKTEVL